MFHVEHWGVLVPLTVKVGFMCQTNVKKCVFVGIESDDIARKML